MRKLLLLFLFSPLALMAQNKFGFFSYAAVLDSLPQYRVAMENYDKLKQRCLKEIDHNEQELTRFYVAFLDGHRDFPEPILRKRQKELQQMIDNSIAFRDELKAWLNHAKDSLVLSSRLSVDSALSRVCTELSLSYIIDTDDGGYRYINPMLGQDVTQDIISVILYPERPLRNIVICPNIATDCIPNESHAVPATELLKENIEKADTLKAEQENVRVLNKVTEVPDSINNK